MDFHGLSRKELQGLCKKNKIPANMTNLAMADALTALDKVEGLDEVLNPPTSETQQSPPRTACRSSRRKPVLAEPESSQTLTRTRRATRRVVVDEADQETKNEPAEGADQENVSANLLETPAVPTGRRRGRQVSVRKKTEVTFVEGLEETVVGEEKGNLLETPAVKCSRSRCVDAGSRRNAETMNAEKSAVRVYSTRRSVRLLEQSLEGLSLKEKEITEVLEDNECCKEIVEVKEKKDASGIDMTVMSVQSSGNNNESELCQNLAKSLDNASEMMPELVEVDEKEECGETDGCSDTSALEAEEGPKEKSSLPEEQVSEEVPMEEEELGEENKGIESSDEKVGVQADPLDTSFDVAQESTDKNPDAFEIDYGKRNLNEVDVLESENMEKVTDNIYESSDENEPEVEEESDASEMQEDEEVQLKSPLSPQCNSKTLSLECDEEEVLVAVSVVEDDKFVVPCLRETPAPANQVSPISSGDAKDQTLSDVYVSQAEEFVVAPIAASPMEKLPAVKYSGIARSPFADNTIQGQFPRPAGSATRKSAVKQIKTETANALDTVVDKENNINSLKMEEPKEEEKVKLDDMSLRQLRKKLKDMTLDKKKNNTEEENNGIKVENKRVALQVLPDN